MNIKCAIFCFLFLFALNTTAGLNDPNGDLLSAAEDFTPLHIAATWNDGEKDNAVAGKHQIAELLIKNGADVNARDRNGQSSMHWAAEQQNLDLIRLLTENGGNVRAADKWGSTAAHFAMIMGKKKVLELFKKHDLSENLFNQAYGKFKEKKDKEAVRIYEEALQYFSSAKIYFHYGNSLSNIPGRLGDSVAAYQKALETGFLKSHLVHYNIACSYSRMKNKKEAYKSLETAVKQGYRTFDRMTRDSDLAYLRSQSDWDEFLGELKAIR